MITNGNILIGILQDQASHLYRRFNRMQQLWRVWNGVNGVSLTGNVRLRYNGLEKGLNGTDLQFMVDVAYIFSGSVDGTVSVTKVVLGVGNDEDNSTRLQTASMEVVGTWFKDHKTMVNVISVHDQNVRMNIAFADASQCYQLQ